MSEPAAEQDLVFHSTFNGHHGDIRRTAERALQDVALNVLSYGNTGQIGDLGEELEQMASGYAEFLGKEFVPSLAHMLALEVSAPSDRESLYIEIHDMNRPTGHHTQVGDYDILHPKDPSFWLVEAVNAALDEGLTHEEARARLDKNLASLVVRGTDEDIVMFKRNEELFGYPADDRRNLSAEPFVPGQNPFTQLAERATQRLEAILNELQPEIPAP